VKHVAFKCQSCPVKIRNTVLALEGQQDAKDQRGTINAVVGLKRGPSMDRGRSSFSVYGLVCMMRVVPRFLLGRRRRKVYSLKKQPAILLHSTVKIAKRETEARRSASRSLDEDQGKVQHPKTRNSNIVAEDNNPRTRLVSVSFDDYEHAEGENVPPTNA